MLRSWLVLAPVFAAACGAGRFQLPSPAGSSRATTLEIVSVQAAPVLDRGAAGEFDSSDVLNPSVAGEFNFYSGFDGKTWHTGVASKAGKKLGKVLSPSGWEGDYIAANGAALMVSGGYLYWYQAGRIPQIALARSRDGIVFVKDGDAVLRVGPYRSWDERGVADPYVLPVNGEFFLYYTGMDRGARQQLGLARSSDGVHWQKHAANPILEVGAGPLDDGGLGEPAVFASGGVYWMLYTGRAWDEQRRILLARSEDGVAWKRVKGWFFAGREAWDRKVVCDPTVVVGTDGLITMWFGGGDVASPDERLNGKIGVAVLRAK